jgi:hypothetical protein
VAEQDKFRYPDQFLADLLRKGARDEIGHRSENPTIFHRALVIAVDVIGGKLQNPGASGKLVQKVAGKDIEVAAIAGPPNPMNSIKARIISDGFDQFINDDDLRIFYPFLPDHISVPVKPGEHVFVTFEDAAYQNGLWLWKVPGHQGINIVPGEKTFLKANNSKLSNLFPETSSASSPDEDLATDEAAGESGIKSGRLTSLFT